MKLFFKLILVASLLVGVNEKAVAMGLADWSGETKNKTLFNDPGDGIAITLEDGTEYKYLGHWYFYKNHIIGCKRKNASSRQIQITTYFVIDELTSHILEFNDKKAWQQHLSNEGLSPWFWTRWYRDNWKDFRIITLWAMLLFPISIPLVLGYLYLICKLITAESFGFFSKKNFELFMPPLLLLMVYLLDLFPGSI